jgi:cell division protein FtsB
MMDMIYQVKKNTDDIEELKQENINLRNELNEIKREIYAQKGKIL